MQNYEKQIYRRKIWNECVWKINLLYYLSVWRKLAVCIKRKIQKIQYCMPSISSLKVAKIMHLQKRFITPTLEMGIYLALLLIQPSCL